MGPERESAEPGWSGLLRSCGTRLLHEPPVRRRAWIVLAAFLVCGYAVWVLGYVIANPELGVRCAFTPVVNHFYSAFLYPQFQSPLREGDRIVAVGGHGVENWSQYLRATLQLRNQPAEPVPGLTAADLVKGAVPADRGFLALDGHRLVRVDYERPGAGDGKRRTVWCKLGPAPLEALTPSILWFFLKIGLFVVAAVVFWKRPEDRSAGQFFWLGIVSLGAFMGGYHWSRIATQPVLILVFMICGVMLPAVTLHFYLLFPRPKAFFERQRRRVLLCVYGPPVFFLLMLVQGYLLVSWLDQGGRGLFANVESNLPDGGSSDGARVLLVMLYEIYAYFAIAALWYLLSLLCLVHSFRTAATPMERNQVKWVLLGVGAAALPIGYTLYLAVWEQERFGGGGATWPMFAASACVTGAYAVSITRYRLMQLDQLISSGAVYFLISTVAGLVYYGLVLVALLVVGSRGESPSLHQVVIVSGTAMLVMVLLDLARGRFKVALDRHFRRDKHQLDRTLQRMSQAIDRLVDPPTLARRLLHTTAEMLAAPGGAVYLRQGDPPLYRLTEAIGPAPPLAELAQGFPLVEAMRAQGATGAPLVLPDPLSTGITTVAAPGSPALRQLHFLGGAAAQALAHEGHLLGLLVLAPRPQGPYTGEEGQVLAAFAQMTALALVSAEGHRTIEALNRDLKTKVEKIAEQQRRILALQSQLQREDQGTSRQDKPTGRQGDKEAGNGDSSSVSLSAPPPVPLASHGLVGSSDTVQHLLQLVKRVAPSSSAVLLRGESGTGKGVLARAIHESSPRARKPFVKVHCAELSPGLLESELFGHVKGAFTSAIKDKVGRFESANGGTLFFDEIGDISLEVQTKLLRVLEEMTFERVGSSEPVEVDVRIIAATHRDLEGMIARGQFREDLFFRLNVLPVVVPPLRERIEDIPELVQHFLRLYAQRAARAVAGADDDVLAVLKAFAWPGNVRQLENVIERAVLFAEGLAVTLADLPAEVLAFRGELDGPVKLAPEEGNGLSLPELATAMQAERAERDRREREQLVRALAAAGGNKAVAARALGLARSTLVSRLKKFGLS
jgi:transcriptional regulator with GAF, ATPase, and Fis domain